MNPQFNELLGFSEHPSDTVLAIDPDGRFRTWDDFLRDVKECSAFLATGNRKVVIYSEDPYIFSIAFAASIQTNRDIYLPGFVGESLFHDVSVEDALFLGDGSIPGFRDVRKLPEPSGTFPARTAGRIILMTSGSTGEPKLINKDVRQFRDEVAVLAGLWESRFKSSVVCSTVSHQHFYGLLFSVLVPMASGVPFLRERIDYPEQLGRINSNKITLVSSPAFLKRIIGLDRVGVTESCIDTIFSSGGPLPVDAARFSESHFHAQVWEIYGSTETGGVAYRRISEGMSWKPFAGIDIVIRDDERLVITSNYLESREPFVTQDLALNSGNGSFILKGRSDSVVKIEEKRVSLNEMEEKLEESEYVARARILQMENHRQYIGAIVVLNETGEGRIQQIGRPALISLLKKSLGFHFAPVVLPRKWRFVEDFPVNDMGKVPREDLVELFRPKINDFDYEIAFLDTRACRMTVKVIFPEDHLYFKGHFPGTPILPGVAQVFAAVRLARRYFNLQTGFHAIPRMKFARPILPDEEVILKLSLDSKGTALKYDYRTMKDGTPISSGTIRKEHNAHAL